MTIILTSCSNELLDCDILGLTEWSQDINQLKIEAISNVNEMESQMYNSGLELVKEEEINCNKTELTNEQFFYSDKAFFPAYKDSLTAFRLYTYNELDRDTTMLHFNMEYLKGYVDSILVDTIDYIVKRLTWKYNGSEFFTIALYDKYDELVYDNILFNLLRAETVSTRRNVLSYLTRGENPIGIGDEAGTRRVTYVGSLGIIAAESWLWWEEYGHMARVPLYKADTIYAWNYHYVHDYLDTGGGSWTINSNFSVINRFVDISTTNEARFTYCIWAGPVGYKPDVSSFFVESNFAPGLYYSLSEFVGDGLVQTEGWVEMKTFSIPDRIVYN